ncbi:minor capsid protein [Acetivibrio clariflavus]|uniref:minor capsid protein n=1 Tax=Acetivibrio clariflavus TaxID=288965 RepID=UPI00145ECFE7|nr:minor capsid protein [Acetivibrio clariflavus]
MSVSKADPCVQPAYTDSILESYKRSGYKQYEFMATLDDKCCSVCRKLDGRHFRINKAVPGKNYPPLHDGCRCTTVYYDPEE